MNSDMAAEIMSLKREIADLREQVAFLNSKEVCTSPHSDDVIQGCPYCRYETLLQRHETLKKATKKVVNELVGEWCLADDSRFFTLHDDGHYWPSLLS